MVIIKMVKVSAPGNLFFFGEHSVVYGRPAILAAIDKRTYVRIEENDNESINVSSEGYGEIETVIDSLDSITFESHEDYGHQMDPIMDLIQYFHNNISEFSHGFTAEITSDIPKESGGMSSSTAVLSAFLGALSKLYDANVSKRDYFEHLYPIQVKIHGGSASGSEITSSSMGGYNRFRIDKSADDADFNFENIGKYSYPVVVGDTGIEASTGETVPYVREGWKKDNQSYERIFDEISDIAIKGEKALVDGKIDVVGKLMDKNQDLLKTLGVSHPRLEQMVDVAREHGALGAKLSGGGKGGIMIAICKENNMEDIAEAISEIGRESYISSVGVDGLRQE